jgi:hypothetical protein
MQKNNELPGAASPFDDEPIVASEAATQSIDISIIPRLSILHLMVWTGISAAMMALLQLPSEAANRLSSFESAYRIGMAIYGGVVVSGLVLWIAWRRRGIPFPTEPGEWLLVVQGAIMLVAIAAIYVANQDPAAMLVLAIGVFLTIAGIGVVPVSYYRQSTLWRVFFGALALAYALPLVSLAIAFTGVFILVAVLGFAFLGITGLVAVLFVVALISDLSHRTVRGWPHWAGVISFFLFGLFHVALWIAAIVSRYR